MKKKREKFSPKKKMGNMIKNKIMNFKMNDEFISNMRWVLFVAAFVLLFLAFEVNDDWFVREFANYDWARSIGF